MVVSVGARTVGVADRSGPVALTRDLAHPDDEIAWTVYGQVTVELPGYEHTLDADHLLWLPAGTPHRMTAGPDSLLVPLWTPAGVVRPGGVPAGPTLCRVDAPLRRALAAALQGRLGEQEEEAFLVTELLGLLAVRAVVGEGLPLPRADPARAVADAVLADPAVRRPMTELAAAVHVSPKTLQRSFVAQTGLSFARWRVTAVCHRGRRLIADGQSVQATATALGYRSTSAFVQSYAGVFGTTPGAHRRSSASCRIGGSPPNSSARCPTSSAGPHRTPREPAVSNPTRARCPRPSPIRSCWCSNWTPPTPLSRCAGLQLQVGEPLD